MSAQEIGRYEIIGEVGRGGMATVYRAHDPRFKRDVVVKVLPREFLHDPGFKARFEREAQTIAALEHPAIVPVYDFGEQDGQPYLVMRFMAGGSLADRLKKGPLSLDEAATFLKRIGSALDHAHSQGVIHRDLKPSNIIFDQYGNAYLADFGIARLMESTAVLTRTGTIIGTPEYMSPEQVQGDEEIDGRSDIYALGIILFEMLTGQQPYQADTPAKVMMKHVLEPVPRVRDVKPELPAGCEATINRAMAKERDDRYPTAAMLVATVDEVVATEGKPQVTSSETLIEPVPATPETVVEPAETAAETDETIVEIAETKEPQQAESLPGLSDVSQGVEKAKASSIELAETAIEADETMVATAETEVPQQAASLSDVSQGVEKAKASSMPDAAREVKHEATGPTMDTSGAAFFVRQWWRVGAMLLAVAVFIVSRLFYVPIFFSFPELLRFLFFSPGPPRILYALGLSLFGLLFGIFGIEHLVKKRILRGGIFILVALGCLATAFLLAIPFVFRPDFIWLATMVLAVLALVLSLVDAIRSDQLVGSEMGTSEAASFVRPWWRVGALLLAMAVFIAIKLGYVFIRFFSFSSTELLRFLFLYSGPNTTVLALGLSFVGLVFGIFGIEHVVKKRILRGGLFIVVALGYLATAYQVTIWYNLIPDIVWYATMGLTVLAIGLSIVDAIRREAI